MGRRIFNIPVLLLIPLALLLIVIVAGVYRFSLNDDEIMDKFSSSQSADSVVEAIFGLKVPNVLVIPVPETQANAVFSEFNFEHQIALASFDSGKERGTVVMQRHPQVTTDLKLGQGFVSVISVSNQGSGNFYYLVSLGLDRQRTRLVALDRYFLGDRVLVSKLQNEVDHISIIYYEHGVKQAMSDDPSQKVEKQLVVNDLGKFIEK
ncbi:hypothetical protein ACPV5R_02295 [Vibrio astriarenae]